MKEKLFRDVKNFAKKINEGYGWIDENDVMRQFYSIFPEYEHDFFDKSKIENFVVNELKNFTAVKSGNEEESESLCERCKFKIEVPAEEGPFTERISMCSKFKVSWPYETECDEFEEN